MESIKLVQWLDPVDCDPPHEVRKPERLTPLIEAFLTAGFDLGKPALIGYVLNGRIQLLSGTHRHAAAKIAGIQIPVTVWLGSQIDRSWGTLEDWARVMRDIPVRELETANLAEYRSR